MKNPNQKSFSGIAISSFVLGIVAILTSTILYFNDFSIIAGIIGFVFGLIAVIKICKEKNGKGLAIAGIVLSSVAIICVFGTQIAYYNAINQLYNESLYSLEKLESYYN